jgi:hypothetical protein
MENKFANTGIAEKIKSILQNMFENTKNSFNIKIRFLEKFPKLLKKFIYKLGLKFTYFNYDKHVRAAQGNCCRCEDYIKTKDNINKKYTKLICNDIKHLINIICNFDNFTTYETNLKIKFFKLEMILLRSLILLNNY